MEDRIWTVSNALSLLRLCLVVPIVFTLRWNSPEGQLFAAVLILLAVASDLLDGWLARRLGEVTQLGKILDPIADKVAVAAVAAFMLWEGMMPAWYFSLLILRDALILAGGTYIRRKHRLLLQSNSTGKWAVTSVALFIFLRLFLPAELSIAVDAVFYVSVAMLVLSFGLYARRFFEIAAAEVH